MKKQPSLLGTRVVKLCSELGIPPENMGSYLFVLMAIRDGDTGVLDAFDDYNSDRRALLLYEDMKQRGLLRLGEDDEPNNYYLTEIGEQLTDIIYSRTPKEEAKQDRVDQVMDIMSFIWVRYPAQDNTGRLLRTGKEGCIKKMTLFLNQYNYSAATVKEAIELYLQQKESKGLQYIHTVSNLIMKNEIIAGSRVLQSTLAEWCEVVETGYKVADVLQSSERMI